MAGTLQAATASLTPPFAVVDLDALDLPTGVGFETTIGGNTAGWERFTAGPRPMIWKRSDMAAVPSLVMNNGLEIPQLGFGVFLVPPEETKQAVAESLKTGYRLIDTAQGYKNEEGVGAAIAESDVSRDELFITTKLTNSEQGYDNALAAFDGSMKKLGLDVLDLFLIHWPLPMFDQYVETWRAFEKLLGRRTGALDRRVQLRDPTPRTSSRRNECDAGGQPGRAAP